MVVKILCIYDKSNALNYFQAITFVSLIEAKVNLVY